MKDQFTNSDGTPTHSAFACGTVLRAEDGGKRFKEMYMEHNHFHVRKGLDGDGFAIWETFADNELTKARKLYKSIKL